MKCPSCKGLVSPEAAACPHCGHPIKPNRKSSSGLGTVLFLGLLICFALVTTNMPSDEPLSEEDVRAEIDRLAEQEKVRQQEYLKAISQRKIMVGMSRDQVRRSWGRPNNINASGGAYGTTEQWVYSSAHLYFDGDNLTSWQTQE